MKLTLRVHTYPLAQPWNNMHVLELQRKMKMLRSDSLFRLFANCNKKMTRKLQKKNFSVNLLCPLNVSLQRLCFQIVYQTIKNRLYVFVFSLAVIILQMAIIEIYRQQHTMHRTTKDTHCC